MAHWLDDGRYSFHMDWDDKTENYATDYGYDVDDIYGWAQEHDGNCEGPDFIARLLSDNLNAYGHIAEWCSWNGIDGVVDIGCSHAYQSLIFTSQGIEYLGLEPEFTDFYDNPLACFQVGTYPESGNLGFKCAISSCCVGTGVVWPVEEIAQDFDVFVGNCYDDFWEEITQYYPNYEEIQAEDLTYHPEWPRIPMRIAAVWRDGAVS